MAWPFTSFILTACYAAILQQAVGTTALEELTYPLEKFASEGRHALTIGYVDFGNYSFDTRGFDGGLPGPTFRMYPGDTLLITLYNNLSADNSKACSDANAGHFCETSVTNLHTHGLHVSSKGRREGWNYSSDDIFADVQPGMSEDFRFEIPDYHMPGTHWYHPHHHHATALQAGGGAAGVLIVNDPPGYLPAIYADMPEKILMFTAFNLQTLQNMATIADSNLLENAVAQATADDLPTNIFNVNGQSGPQLTVTAHTWFRFRMIYAAVEQSLDLTITESTNGASCTFQLLAKDGVYLHTFPRTVRTIYLYPGARADAAVSCTCDTYPCTATLGSSTTRRRLQEKRRMQPKPKPPGMGDGGAGPAAPGADTADVNIMLLYIQNGTDSTTPTLPSTTLERPCYVVDLRGVTVPSGNSGTLALQGGERRVQWNGFGESMTHDNVHDNGGTKYTWPPITTFTSGNVYEMSVQGAQAHPLHMHINPYQITSLPGGPYGDDDYFQVGDWHDTLLIPDLGAGNDLGIRLQTDRFTSKMVIHCHILEHEDEGMMAFIQIDGEDGAIWADAEDVDPQCLRSALVKPVENSTTSSTSRSWTTTMTSTSSMESQPSDQANIMSSSSSSTLTSTSLDAHDDDDDNNNDDDDDDNDHQNVTSSTPTTSAVYEDDDDNSNDDDDDDDDNDDHQNVTSSTPTTSAVYDDDDDDDNSNNDDDDDDDDHQNVTSSTPTTSAVYDDDDDGHDDDDDHNATRSSSSSSTSASTSEAFAMEQENNTLPASLTSSSTSRTSGKSSSSSSSSLSSLSSSSASTSTSSSLSWASSSSSSSTSLMTTMTTTTSTSSSSTTTSSSSSHQLMPTSGISVPGNAVISFGDGGADAFYNAYQSNSPAIEGRLKAAIVAPLAANGFTTNDVIIDSVTLVSRRLGASRELTQNTSSSVVVEYTIVVRDELTLSTAQLENIMEGTAAATTMVEKLRQGLTEEGLSVTITGIQVTTSVITTTVTENLVTNKAARGLRFLTLLCVNVPMLLLLGFAMS